MGNDSHQRRDRLIKEKRHDVYREKGQWPEPTACTSCGALYVDGRWSWKKPPRDAHQATCPACHRITDGYPAGFVEVRGTFIAERREELISLMRHVEEREKSEHPMERIIAVTREDDHTLVTTTGIHIARSIGEALSRSYSGDLRCQYAEEGYIIRVSWQRDL
jgi:hypothetical protein